MKDTEIAAPMGGAVPQGRAGREGHPSLAVVGHALAERSRHHHTDRQWSGVPLRRFQHTITADTRARHVAFGCADGTPPAST